MATRSLTVCRYPGCSKPGYKEPSGYTHNFCGRTHAEMYRSISLTSPTSAFSYSRPAKSAQTTKSALKPLKAFQKYVSPSSNEIKFYNSYDPFYEFTNFYPTFMTINGSSWPSSEHYFQAQKFVGTPYVEKIRKMSSARETFQFSRNPAVSRWRRSDWDQVKDNIMLKALRCKFGQSDRLRSLLLGTGDKKLIEHTENDSYWGDGGGKGKGLNKLGELLMKVRRELKEMYKTKSGSPLKKRSSSFSFNSTTSKPKYIDDMDISLSSSGHNPLLLSRHLSGSLSSLHTPSSTPKVRCSSPSLARSPLGFTPRTQPTNDTSYLYTKHSTATYTPTPSQWKTTSQSTVTKRPKGNDSSQVAFLFTSSHKHTKHFRV
ncbi:uncharacterized protein LOC135346159 isoform X2 [Halichondria panicea]|uniref:uncharacterized protein LOC135346159 isoform X2 n=1 Tax=Halichondria panicea TaxID=6063 RepID=UPI00312B3ADB